MKLKKINSLLVSGNKVGSYKIIIGIVCVIFISNINAIVDLILHPEIPYFDLEHIIVGLISSFFTFIFFLIAYQYIRRLNKINNERHSLAIELIKAKEKAEESDRLKSAFLANISHEIRTPMNGILGFSEIISNRDLSEKKFNQYVEIIHNCGNQLMSIINDIIDLSKIEANLIKIKSQPENINDILKEIHILLQQKANSSSIKLSYSCEFNDDNCEILTDGDRIRQILINLINNALKFTKQGYIKFGYTLKGDGIEFFVQDSGIGISTEMQTKIFERFIQVDSENTRLSGGTGLGLAISKGITELLGGKIWLQSEIDKGSVFYFTIPYKPVESNHTTDIKPKEQMTHLKVIKILVVEDDFINFLYLSEILSLLNVKLVHVSNGIAAIDLIKQNPDFDLILMDLKMPGIDGLKTTQEIKKINKDLPIIAQTAYALSGDREKAIEAGCDDYISKPYNKSQLREMILKYIN